VVQVLLVKEVRRDGGGSAGGGEVEVGGLRLCVKVVGDGVEEVGDEAVHGSGGVLRLEKVRKRHGVGGGCGGKQKETKRKERHQRG